MEFFKLLTDKEREFFNCLQNVEEQSLWGYAISNVVKSPDVERYRGLIKSLKSQAQDCEPIMVNILGQECFDNLLNL
jgi:hypothetical protein